MMSAIKKSVKAGDQEITMESGFWAKQADGAITYRVGNLVILAAVCAQYEAKKDQAFFPLSVDYREKFYAAGRIPGSFFRREMRPSEHEVLISRLIDRTLRPLFPKGYLCEVQMIVEILSYDPNIATEGHAITAASAALMVSDIPFDGPVAGVRIGGSLGSEKLEPSAETVEKGDLDVIIGGNRETITMIEGSANEIPAEDMLKTLEMGLSALQPKIELQEKIVQEVAPSKREYKIDVATPDWSKKLHAFAKEPLQKVMAIDGKKDKAARMVAERKLREEIQEYFAKEAETLSESQKNDWANNSRYLSDELHELEYQIVREALATKKLRADGRNPKDIRDISIELDVLPQAHGSAVFTRGQTQALGTVTLGTRLDNQRLDTLDGMKERRFLLHYNFPAFSVGEIRRGPGPSRREVGHGNLAYRAVKNVVPKTQEEFPYIIRVVSEILESNGSSSMATVCATSLALMAAGVPVRSPVAGIAMGLMRDVEDKPVILSDIAGIEDHFGDMDFKLAGTAKGITAFQLDLKVKSLSTKVLSEAMTQATAGIAHILAKMSDSCSKSRSRLSPHAPCISFYQVDVERIGELIGPGGKMIRTLSEKTGAEINVDDKGLVSLVSRSAEINQKGLVLIKDLFREIKAGDAYTGPIRKITDFGAFVEILPGREGLLHISKMARERVEKVSDLFSVGDQVKVKVLAVDRTGKMELVIEEFYDDARKSDGGQEFGRGGGGRRNGGGGGGRFSRPPRGGGDRSFGDRDRSFGDRRERGGGGERSRGGRSYGGGDRSYGDRPQGAGRGGGDRDHRRKSSRGPDRG